MSALNQSIPQTPFGRPTTRTRYPVALSLRTPRWRQPRCNVLALTLLIGAGGALALLL
jgi:hypothetical protein